MQESSSAKQKGTTVGVVIAFFTVTGFILWLLALKWKPLQRILTPVAIPYVEIQRHPRAARTTRPVRPSTDTLPLYSAPAEPIQAHVSAGRSICEGEAPPEYDDAAQEP